MFFFNPITLDNLISFFQIVSGLKLIKSTLFIQNEVGVTLIVMGRDRVVLLKIFWLMTQFIAKLVQRHYRPLGFEKKG